MLNYTESQTTTNNHSPRHLGLQSNPHLPIINSISEPHDIRIQGSVANLVGAACSAWRVDHAPAAIRGASGIKGSIPTVHVFGGILFRP